MDNDTQPVTETLRDGSKVTIRPLRRQDVELERRFIEALSPQSRRYRFLCSFSTPTDALLDQLTDLDPQGDAALIALAHDRGEPREIGVARFSSTGQGKAEVAVTVSDEWQHKGLGSALMQRLISLARQRGLRELYSVDAADNAAMRELTQYLGFRRDTDPDDPTQVIHTLQLKPAGATGMS